MAPGPNTDPLVRAAVHAAHFERWRRLYSPTQFFVPKGLERLLPESAQAIPSLLKAAKPVHAGDQRGVRSAVATLARARSDLVQQVLRQQGADDRIFNEHGESLLGKNGVPGHHVNDPFGKLPTGYVQKAQPGAAPGCRCADAFSRCKGSSSVDVVCHHSTLSFNADTFISEATEYVILKADRQEATKLILNGRPPNWAKAGGEDDLFEKTVVCNGRGKLDTDAKYAPFNHNQKKLPEQFFLREKTAWQTNRDFAALSDIVLNVTGYTEVLDESGELKLEFDYQLRECIETQFFIARSAGGINVDEGMSRVRWVPERPESNRGLLYIYASKRLRFTQTRDIGREEALVLNMMAPSILSMLMQRLAFDQPLELVTGHDVASSSPRSPSAPPASVSRPVSSERRGDEWSRNTGVYNKVSDAAEAEAPKRARPSKKASK
jgi:hypothetical protein